jgi:hypothetical protein
MNDLVGRGTCELTPCLRMLRIGKCIVPSSGDEPATPNLESDVLTTRPTHLTHMKPPPSDALLDLRKKLGRRRPHNSEGAKDDDDDGDEWIPVKRRCHTLPKRRGAGELINVCPDNLPSRFTHNFTAVFLLGFWWLFEKT